LKLFPPTQHLSSRNGQLDTNLDFVSIFDSGVWSLQPTSRRQNEAIPVFSSCEGGGDGEGGSGEDVNEPISKLAVLTILRVESGDESCIHQVNLVYILLGKLMCRFS
jgi:hypothetical protein